MLTYYYAQTDWPTVHRDSCNTGSVPFDGPDSLVANWTALDGARVLAPVTMGPEGRLYITTGKEPKSFHLHAFDRDGVPIWSSDLLNLNAVFSSAVVDRFGDIYIGDSEKLFAFYPNGELKWSIPISDIAYSTAITIDGYLVAITQDGGVMALNREDGSLAAEILSLVPGPEGEVINTPAIHPVSNRIYIVTGGYSAPRGYFYGIDFEPGNLIEVFKTPMGSNSATSPTISHDGNHIYVADRDEYLYAFNTDGSLAWQYPLRGQCLASVSAGPSGVVYFIEDNWKTAGVSCVTAIADDMVKGPQFLWDTIDEFEALAHNDYYLSDLGYTRIAVVNSIVSITTNYLYVAVALGYLFPYDGTDHIIPHLTLVCTIDPENGSIIGEPAEVRDVCEGSLTVASDGSIYVTHGSIASSAAYQLNDVLPPELRVPEPPGGITAIRPIEVPVPGKGDVSGNGEITAYDASLILQVVVRRMRCGIGRKLQVLLCE